MCAVYRTEAHRTEHSAGCQHRRNTDSAGGFGHGWCISKGDVLIQHPSQCLPCYARSTSSSFPPCSMPQTHRPFGSKQGIPHRSPGWTEGAGPSRKGYPIQGPPDGEEQTRRARGCAWAVGLGQALPTESPVPRAGEGPLSTMCVGWAGHGDPPATTCPQTHSLHSESCAEGQLNSSLAVISRLLTPLHRSTAAEGPLPGRRGPVGSQFLWPVLWALVCLSSLWLRWSFTRGSTCEQDPHLHLTTQMGIPADFSRLWGRPWLNKLGITGRQSLRLGCSHQHRLFWGLQSACCWLDWEQLPSVTPALLLGDSVL